MARYQKGSTPKLTNALIEELERFLRLGSYIETAVAACGITKDSFYRWLKKGKQDTHNTLERKLSYAVSRAMAEAELRDLEVVDTATKGFSNVYAKDAEGNIQLDSKGRPILLRKGCSPDWKAAAWRLSRKFPKRWGECNRNNDNDGQTENNNSNENMIIEFVDPK